MRRRAAELGGLGAEPVAVGFSPPEALAALADHVGWRGPFLADTARVLYRRLGLPRAHSRGQVWTPGTRAAYRRAAAKGSRVYKPVEDALQLGGDAVVTGGTVVRLWRPASPDDRPPVEDLLAALRAAAGL